MGTNTLIKLIDEAIDKAYNGLRYDEADVLYTALEQLRHRLAHPEEYDNGEE